MHVDPITEGWLPLEGRWTVTAAKACCGTVRPAPRYRNAGIYVAVCRRLYPEVFGACAADLDGRLIGVAWNHLSPSVWARHFEAFLRYWWKVAPRPEIVGSSHNPDYPDAFDGWRSGTPALVVSALRGGRWRSRRKDRCAPWRKRPLGQRRRLVFTAIAARRASLAWDGRHFRFDVRALAMPGRLCPEGQAAVVERIPEDVMWRPDNAPIRARDLVAVIAAARPVLEALQRDQSGRVRMALALRDGDRIGRRALELSGLPIDEALLGFSARLAPAYPSVPLSVARRLCLGESPRQIAEGALNAAEAHRWCVAGAPPIAEWLQQELLGGMAEVPVLRDPAIVRWVAAVKRRGAWGQLTKERPLHLPGGEERTWRALDRIDEVQVEDLVKGERTSVDAAFESAAQRAGAAWAERAREDHRALAPLPRGWRPYRRIMRHLYTPALLEREGREMDHCVGGY